MKICIDCGDEFNPKEKKSDRGLITQCDDCSQHDDTVRVLGFNDGSLNKSVSISLYKGDDPRVRKSIQTQRNRTGGF